MKIKFRNYGPIEEANIDLKPLTIFVGPNNAGKTWTAYALASIFGPFGHSVYADAYIRKEITDTYPTLDQAIEQVIKQGAATFDLVQFASDNSNAYFNNVAKYIQQWLADFLSTELATFDNVDISIELAETKAQIEEQVFITDFHADVKGTEKESVLTIRKIGRDKEILIYSTSRDTSSQDVTVEEISPLLVRDFLINSVFQIIHRAIYRHIRILPTERTTAIAHPLGYNFVNGEKQIPDETREKRNLRMAPVGLGHFISMMTDIDQLSERRRRDRTTKSNSQVKEYVRLAELLEKQILGGKLKYPEANLNQNEARGILFQPSTGKPLEVSVASSMVKELAPLLFYLRYLAIPRELIIIDEPEMNLHPEAQVKLIEFLSILVNANIFVLITTHSPYLIDHLSNLIKANDSEDKELVKNEFYLKRAEAFIAKDKVSVYLFDQGQARNVIDNEGSIDLNTFGRVSDRVSDIYFSLP